MPQTVCSLSGAASQHAVPESLLHLRGSHSLHAKAAPGASPLRPPPSSPPSLRPSTPSHRSLTPSLP
eukprot:6172471-Pleurochrysis_carterae.AAC.2